MTHNKYTLFLFATLFFSCTDDKKDEVLYDFNVEENSSFKVEFGVSFSSGYQWILSDSLSENVTLLEEGFVENDSINAKFPEIQKWTFKANTSGIYRITFIYKRPWEPNSDGQKTKNINVMVK